MNSIIIHSARNVAMDYLARRDHSKFELEQKLKLKGFDGDLIEEALNKLIDEKLLSDARFAQSYIHYRVSKGVGPVKIRHELKQKGINVDVIHQAEEQEAIDWYEMLITVAERKYGTNPVKDFKDKQKRSRFLQQRGFVMHDIMRLFTH